MKITFLFALIFVSLSGFGQVNEGMTSSMWSTDFSTAVKEANKEKKLLLLYFSGSDWCKPCIRLSNDILNTVTFSKYAEENFVPVQLDFPRMKKNRLPAEQVAQNEALAEMYNPNGVFPLLVILDNNKEIVGFAGFRKVTPDEYITVIDNIIKK